MCCVCVALICTFLGYRHVFFPPSYCAYEETKCHIQTFTCILWAHEGKAPLNMTNAYLVRKIESHHLAEWNLPTHCRAFFLSSRKWTNQFFVSTMFGRRCCWAFFFLLCDYVFWHICVHKMQENHFTPMTTWR